MGTSCMFSVRRCAVTVISAIPSDSFVSAAGAACATPMADPLKIAAIAYDNFWLEFMRPSLLLMLLSNYHHHSTMLRRHNRTLSSPSGSQCPSLAHCSNTAMLFSDAPMPICDILG